MFDGVAFVEECRAALRASDVLGALRAAVARALSDRESLVAALPVRSELRVTVLCAEPGLTVAQLVGPRGFSHPPHDHRMLSVVGVYSGVEENVYYRRVGRGLEEIARHSVNAGEVIGHAHDVVHSISSVSAEPLAAIHVYAGDFFTRPRSEWSGDPPEERPYDLARLRRLIDG